MFKRIMTLTMALLMCVLSLSAQAAVTPDGALPIVDEPTELTIWVSIPGGMEDYVNNPTTAWYEEVTGVHVNWIEVANAEAATLFNTSIASGEYPDIYCYSLSGADTLTYAEDGVIIPLNDLIDEHAYYLKQRFESDPSVREAVTAPDGNIYMLPSVNYAPAIGQPNKLWVYKEWLERYMTETGAEKPNDPAELEAMLLFFRDNDMNGNGDTTDEIIMTGQYNYGFDGGNPVYYLLNAYAFVPVNGRTRFFYADEEGNMMTDVMTDEFREGLRWVNHLYEEGLIAEETFVQDLVTFRTLTTTTRDKVIVATAGAPYPFRLLVAQPGVENAVEFGDYEVLMPLEGADGVAVTPGHETENISMRCFITSACEQPEVAMRWLDYFFSEEMQQYVTYGGAEGEGWEWQDVPSLGGGDKAAVSLLNAEEYAAIWNPDFVGTRWRDAELQLAMADAGDETTIRVKINEMYEPYVRNVNIPSIVWCTDMDLAIEFSELQTLLYDYITAAINEFVLGIRDVDSDEDWQEYVSTLEDMGCEHYMEIAETYYFG